MRLFRWIPMLAMAGMAFHAHGFGMGTHAYVAWRVCGTPWMTVIYASTVPDCFGLGSSPEIKSQLQSLTHHEFDRMEPSPFALGLATHNGSWGADHYAHCYYDPSEPETYFTARMRQLGEEFGFSINRGEDVVEAMVDYMLRRDLGTGWGEFLARAADSFDAADRQQLVDAFAWPLSERVSGLSVAGAQLAVETMATQWQLAIRAYGQLLALQDIAAVRNTLVQGMASLLSVDTNTAEQVLARAEVLCADYRQELDAIAVSIRNELKLSAYPLPACGAFPLILAMVAAAAAGLRRR